MYASRVVIIIPASVVTIGDNAFRNNGSMQSLQIADGSQLNTIGENASPQAYLSS